METGKETKKTAEQWAKLQEDAAFADYLIKNYSGQEIFGGDFEAICRGYYGGGLFETR